MAGSVSAIGLSVALTYVSLQPCTNTPASAGPTWDPLLLSLQDISSQALQKGLILLLFFFLLHILAIFTGCNGLACKLRQYMATRQNNHTDMSLIETLRSITALLDRKTHKIR